jgi:hypothetical protein
MHRAPFSFTRFVELLRRTLEVSIVVGAVVRSILFLVWWRSRGDTTARLLLDDASGFLILCVLVFLLLTAYRLCVEGRRAAFLALRAFVYVVFLVVSPAPLGPPTA